MCISMSFQLLVRFPVSILERFWEDFVSSSVAARASGLGFGHPIKHPG